jgi:natural product biosynthesis luciferase-like monooxygenase protein
MFFSSADQRPGRGNYALLIDAAMFADAHGFSGIWTPERHFHEFGGLFPNPALTSAALAMVTTRIQLRAGSLISPLHDAIRIAEEWAVVDNLSGGRAAVSFGSGWNANDFVLAPGTYANRQAVMVEQIALVRSLWRGEATTRSNGAGATVPVSIRPRPVQRDLPIWITSSGNIDTFRTAGSMGANLLTHLIGQDLATLEMKIAAYRAARSGHGVAPETGTVSLMLHTFVGPDLARVKETVRVPFREYLRSAVKLEEQSFRSGGAISGGHRIDSHALPPDVVEDLLDVTFERYFQRAALMGTPSSCLAMVRELEAIGVDEVACLIDFGVDEQTVLDGLEYLGDLREATCGPPLASHSRSR